MKTKEELKALKEEVKAVNAKLAEQSTDELKQVVGGYGDSVPDFRPCLDCTWPCDESCPYFWYVH